MSASRSAAIVLALASPACIFAPQAAFDGRGAPAKQPIDDVIMQVFDKDVDKRITLKEVAMTLDGFAEMSGMFMDPETGQNKMGKLIDAAKKMAPSIFAILDADDSKGLSKKEVVWFAKVQKAFNSGALRNLTRDCFDTLDADSDDSLSADELQAASDVDGAPLGEVVALVHAAFPIRKDAAELKQLLVDLQGAAGAGLAEGVALIDADADGQISRKEAGKAFLAAKKAFLAAVTTLQEMGPMLAMFGGGGGPGGGMPGGRGRGRGRGM